jgi:hypothetical protein
LHNAHFFGVRVVVEFEQIDFIRTRRLSGNGPTLELRKILARKLDHIGNLNPAKFVSVVCTFRFKGKNILGAVSVDADVKIVNFDLTFSLNGGSDVRL